LVLARKKNKKKKKKKKNEPVIFLHAGERLRGKANEGKGGGGF